MAPLEVGSEAVPFAVIGEADAVGVVSLAPVLSGLGGRLAHLAGRMPRREAAVPSSPLGGMLG